MLSLRRRTCYNRAHLGPRPARLHPAHPVAQPAHVRARLAVGPARTGPDTSDSHSCALRRRSNPCSAHSPVRLSRSRAVLLVLAAAVLALLLGSIRVGRRPRARPRRNRHPGPGRVRRRRRREPDHGGRPAPRLGCACGWPARAHAPHSGRYTSGAHRAASPFTARLWGLSGRGARRVLFCRPRVPHRGRRAPGGPSGPGRARRARASPIWLGATAVSWEYRVTLATADPAQSPQVRSITVSFLRPTAPIRVSPRSPRRPPTASLPLVRA